jgi:hypothetical protein
MLFIKRLLIAAAMSFLSEGAIAQQVIGKDDSFGPGWPHITVWQTASGTIEVEFTCDPGYTIFSTVFEDQGRPLFMCTNVTDIKGPPTVIQEFVGEGLPRLRMYSLGSAVAECNLGELTPSLIPGHAHFYVCRNTDTRKRTWQIPIPPSG